MNIREWVERFRVKPSRLLVVDDLDGIADVIKGTLADYNCEYDLAKNGDDASVLLRLNRYDLVLLDITMSGKSGIEVLKEIKLISPDTPVVMMTGYFDGVLLEEAASLGVVSLLRKPTYFTPAFVREIFQIFKIRGVPQSEFGLATTS